MFQRIKAAFGFRGERSKTAPITYATNQIILDFKNHKFYRNGFSHKFDIGSISYNFSSKKGVPVVIITSSSCSKQNIHQIAQNLAEKGFGVLFQEGGGL